MQIHLIAMGKRMPKWVVEGYQNYADRLPKQFRLTLLEIDTPKRHKSSNIQQLIEQEGERMLAAIPRQNQLIALDEAGHAIDTLKLAQTLQSFHDHGQDLTLLIGGPDGLSPACLNKADAIWSLSKLTLPHPLVRIVIAEQIYRAFSILSHHPYHRP